MEVFLHKKDMPKSCTNCIFLTEHYCLLTGDIILTATNKEDIKNNRYSTCPLQPLNESELVPKYKKGDKVYRKDFSKLSMSIVSCLITDIHLGITTVSYTVKGIKHRLKENELYSTEIEAQQGLILG